MRTPSGPSHDQGSLVELRTRFSSTSEQRSSELRADIQDPWGSLAEWEVVPDPDLERLHNEINRLCGAKSDLKQRYRDLGEEIEETQSRMERRERQREELKEITQELTVAQRFLSTADSLSQAEVVRAMEALNEEIFQLTSIVADKVQVERQHHIPEENKTAFRKQIPEWTLSPTFLNIVTHKRLEDTLAIQVGWQMILSCWCSLVIGSWEIDRKVDSDMTGVYRGILSQNDQPIAGRWRSLTLAATDDPSDKAREEMTDDLVQALTALPVLCGYIFDPKSYEALTTRFWERIDPLFEKCLKFRRAVGEGVTSKDIIPYLIEAGTEYDSQEADLEYQDEKTVLPRDKSNIVVCSLGLGLYCDYNLLALDGRFLRHTEVILKPKVILQETLQNIIS